jgi:membrane protein DedA with SNARE-associated domain
VQETFQFIAEHGYAFLFVFVFAEQIGLPVPSVPVLLAGGALARIGDVDLTLAILVSVIASLASDVIWYELGRAKGAKVMQVLCRISLEPDSCVRQTENFFAKYGARGLLIAKFVPGFNTAAPPMAGVFHMRRGRFLLFDATGALLWAGVFIALGWIFGNQIERVVEFVSTFGTGFGIFLVVALAAWIGTKYRQRQRFIRDLRVSRITASELSRKIAAGEDLVIVDLRHAYDFAADPTTVPGAVHIPVEEFEARSHEIPQGQEVILYCT